MPLGAILILKLVTFHWCIMPMPQVVTMPSTTCQGGRADEPGTKEAPSQSPSVSLLYRMASTAKNPSTLECCQQGL